MLYFMRMRLVLKFLLLVGSVFKVCGQEFQLKGLLEDLYREQKVIARESIARLFPERPDLSQKQKEELDILQEVASQQAEQLYIDLALFGVNRIVAQGDGSVFGSLRLLENALLRLEATDSEYKGKRESVLGSLKNDIEHDRAIIIGDMDRISRWSKRGIIGLATAIAGKYMGLYRLLHNLVVGRPTKNASGGGNSVGLRAGSVPRAPSFGGPPAPGFTSGSGSQPAAFSMGSGVQSTGYSMKKIVEGIKHSTLTSQELQSLRGTFPQILGEMYKGLTLLHWAVYWAMSGQGTERQREYVRILAYKNRFINKRAESSASIIKDFVDGMYNRYNYYVKSPIETGGTPLHLAMYMATNVVSDFDIIKILLDQDANTQAVDTLNRTPVKVAFGGLKATKLILLEDGIGSDIVEEVGKKMESARNRLFDLLKALHIELAGGDTKSLRGDKDILQENPDTITLRLYKAVIEGNQSVVEMILRDDPSLINSVYAGKTPLMWALAKGYSKIAVYLVNQGAEFTDFPQGYSLLHYAVKMRDKDLVQAVIAARGVNINKKDALNRTPLFWAVEQGKACIEIIKVLIDSGAEVNDVVRPALEAALYLDEKNGQIEIMKMLIDAKADVNAMQGELLKKALELKNKQPALLLLRAGARLVFLKVKYMPNEENLKENVARIRELKNRLHYVVDNDLIEAIILRDDNEFGTKFVEQGGLLELRESAKKREDLEFNMAVNELKSDTNQLRALIGKLVVPGFEKAKSYLEGKTEKKSYTDNDAEGWTLCMWAAAQGNNKALEIMKGFPSFAAFDNRYNEIEGEGSSSRVVDSRKVLYNKNYEALEKSMEFYEEKRGLEETAARQYNFLERIKREYDEIRMYQKKRS
jgi:ankyrin repeat protein